MTTELEPLARSVELNRLMMRNARQPLAVIAEKTGIPAAEVAERMAELLTASTWRDDLMEEKLLLADLAMLLEEVRTKMSSAFVDDEGWASMARVQLQTMKVLLEQLDKRRKAVNGELASITEEQGRMVATAFMVAQEMAVERIKREHPEFDADVVRTTLSEVLPLAVAEVEKNVAG